MTLSNLNKSDLWFTEYGDFLIDGSGDLKDTRDSGDRLEGLKQAILHRMVGEADAFRLHRNISAGLEQFIGKAIDKELHDRIQQAIYTALTSDGALSRDDFVVRTLEIFAGSLAILVYLNLPNQEHPLITMAWNTDSGTVTRVV